MLEAINLSKSFDEKAVISDFSYRFEPGSRYALMGPSGCGKTTLLNLLMGLLKPDSGSVRKADDLRISAVFQENRLLDSMTAYNNIRLVCQATTQEVTQLLLKLGIEEDSLSQPVSTYSGGMKRRVAIARALLADYDVLMLDEPYKGLDEETRQQVIDTVQSMTEGKTVLLITHTPSETNGYTLIQMDAK
ncbi:MAG: ABC transporter ATP-binding protein [Clostridiales bacterium]|nr:ABC transporter ATP-binding protein [Clostridiales bacterium]